MKNHNCRSLCELHLFTILMHYLLKFFIYGNIKCKLLNLENAILTLMNVNLFLLQGWWLLRNNVELTTAAVVANCIGFLMG